MDRKDELVQVSIALPKSHIPILPELMKVVTTACCSSYSWESMKLSVGSEVQCDAGSRVILNLGKYVHPDSEIIQGKLHRCRELNCKHTNPPEELIGDVKMTSFSQRTLKDYWREHTKNDEEEIEGTGWLEKEISDEMFYPSWYDNLRMKGLPKMDDFIKPAETQLCPNSSVIIVNNVDVHHFYDEPESNEFFPLKQSTKSFEKTTGEISDETFRLKKVCDRAKNCVHRQEDCRRPSVSSPDTNTKIRKLKERLEPSELSHTDIYESFIYVEGEEKDDSERKDYTYRRYLCYDEELPPYPPRISDGDMSDNHAAICDGELPQESPKNKHLLQDTFLRRSFHKNIHTESPTNSKDNDDDSLLILSPTMKNTIFHRSFSANVISQHYNEVIAFARDSSPSGKKREDRRPKSGPERKVDFFQPSRTDEVGKGDCVKICQFQERVPSKTLESGKKADMENLNETAEHQREKKKKRKAQLNVDEVSTPETRKETAVDGLDKKPREQEEKHRDSDNRNRNVNVVISYKPCDENKKPDVSEGRTKHRKSDKEDKPDSKHRRRMKKMTDDRLEEYRPRVEPRVVAKHEEVAKPENLGKTKSKDEGKKPKRLRADKTDSQKATGPEPIKTETDVKPPKSTQDQEVTKAHVKHIPEVAKPKRRGILGKRYTPPLPTLKEEISPNPDDPIPNEPIRNDPIHNEMEEKVMNKRQMSFLELISAMTEEFKHFGKRKDPKRPKNNESRPVL